MPSRRPPVGRPARRCGADPRYRSGLSGFSGQCHHLIGLVGAAPATGIEPAHSTLTGWRSPPGNLAGIGVSDGNRTRHSRFTAGPLHQLGTLTMVRHQGIEPRSVANQATVLPLNEWRNMVGAAGIEPAWSCSRNRCLVPIGYAPSTTGRGGRSRSGDLVLPEHALSQLSYTPMVSVVGIEPTASAFQARTSTSDLHADDAGTPDGNRTRLSDVKGRPPHLMRTGAWRRQRESNPRFRVESPADWPLSDSVVEVPPGVEPGFALLQSASFPEGWDPGVLGGNRTPIRRLTADGSAIELQGHGAPRRCRSVLAALQGQRRRRPAGHRGSGRRCRSSFAPVQSRASWPQRPECGSGSRCRTPLAGFKGPRPLRRRPIRQS